MRIAEAKLLDIEDALSGGRRGLAALRSNLTGDHMKPTARHLLKSLCIDHVERYVDKLPLRPEHVVSAWAAIGALREGENGHDKRYSEVLDLATEFNQASRAVSVGMGYHAGATLSTAFIALSEILKM